MLYKILFDELRAKYKLNKLKFAKKVDLSRQYINKLENLKEPSPSLTQETISKFQNTFGVNPNYLLTGQGSMFLSDIEELTSKEEAHLLEVIDQNLSPKEIDQLTVVLESNKALLFMVIEKILTDQQTIKKFLLDN